MLWLLQDNQGPFVSLMMAYIFNAMAHLAQDVRFMAFKFSDLVVQFYPSSFPFYAEKVSLLLSFHLQLGACCIYSVMCFHLQREFFTF